MTSHSFPDEVRSDALLEAWGGEILPCAGLRSEDGSPPGRLHCALLHRDYGVALLDLAPEARPDAAERFRRLHQSLYPQFPVPPVVYRSLAGTDLWRLTIILDSAFALETPPAETGPDWMDRAREILAGEPEPPAPALAAPVGAPAVEPDVAAAPAQVEEGHSLAADGPRRRLSPLLLLPVIAGAAIVTALPLLRAPQPEMRAGLPAAAVALPSPDPVQQLILEAPPVPPGMRRGDVDAMGDAAPVPAAMHLPGRMQDDPGGTSTGPAAEAFGPERGPDAVPEHLPVVAALPAPATPPPRSLPAPEAVPPQPADPVAELETPAFEAAAAPMPPEVTGPPPPPAPEPPPAGPDLLSDAETGLSVLAALRIPAIPVLAPAPWPGPGSSLQPADPVFAPLPPLPVEEAPPEEIIVAALPPAPAAPLTPEDAVRAEAPEEESARPTAAPAAPAADPALLHLLLRRGDALLALGDVSAARLFYERAAAAGSAPAAVAMARTYDPAILGELGVRGLRPERDAAIAWYRRAVALGGAGASGPLERLEAGGRAR